MSRYIVDSTIVAPTSREPRLGEPVDTSTETTAGAWRPLYLMAAVAALLSVVLIAVAGLVYAIQQPPTTITGWFRLFNDNWLLGLFSADLVMLTTYLLLGPIYLALYGALRRANQPFMLLATALGFVGMAAYFAANPAFSMLSLSSQYATATTDAERTALLGAGQAVITNWTGTAFDVAYLLGAIWAIIVALVMLRSNIFGKVTAYAGLLIGVFGLVPAAAGTLGIVFSFLALIPTVVWFILLARCFFQLGSEPRSRSQ
jgi:Domain of unknown function (DUF4386)